MLEDADSAIGWDHVIEYLDGAISELTTDERKDAIADYREDGIDYLGR
jgi:hypothetical protein